MITTKETPRPGQLSLADLPGPDTSTKREALKCSDARFFYMLKESARIGWPKAYTDDLYRHDLERLKALPNEPLLWILRENGTHLYPLSCKNTHEASYYRSVIAYWSGDHNLNVGNCQSDRARYYLVTDDGLNQITATEADSIMARSAK